MAILRLTSPQVPTDQVETRTDDIATRLASAVNGQSNFSAYADGSTVVITKTNNATFDLATYDSLGDTGLSATLGVVQRFDELPRQAPHGYVVQVQGDQTNNFDDYYVKFEAQNSQYTKPVMELGLNGLSPTYPFEIDRTTMPHLSGKPMVTLHLSNATGVTEQLVMKTVFLTQLLWVTNSVTSFSSKTV